MKTISIRGPINEMAGEIELPPSKSIANRLLLMSSFEKLTQPRERDLPEDILALLRGLSHQTPQLDVGHAGTAFRFLLAASALRPGKWEIRGSDRMHRRPVSPLVDALRQLGAKIKYLKEKGYPPLLVEGRPLKSTAPVKIQADISSQFISALLMIAPYVKNGVEIIPEGRMLSRPYIEMTLQLMKDCGAIFTRQGETIRVEEGKYRNIPDKLERDWSAASYFLGMPLLEGHGKLHFKGLEKSDLQGDAEALDWFKNLGLQSEFGQRGLTVWIDRPSDFSGTVLELDFTAQPDLAQTMTFFCLRAGIKARFGGCYNLNLKETRRLDKLREWVVICGGKLLGGTAADELFFDPPVKTRTFKNRALPTYDDHRFAMSMSLLACNKNQVVLENPEVVNKSFPGFWRALEKAGFSLNVKSDHRP